MRHFTILSLVILVLLMITTATTAAQPSASTTPIEISLLVDRTILNQEENAVAILIFHNTTSYPITITAIDFKSSGFNGAGSSDVPLSLAPYTTMETQYLLRNGIPGTHNAIFAVAYEWDDPETLSKQNRIELTSVNGIKVETPAGFDWPDFLLPLVAGFVIGQLGSLFSDWRKQRKEHKAIRSAILTFLFAARKSVREKEQVPLDLWRETVAKSDLYSVLSRSRKMNLPVRLTELSIALTDYNNREKTSNLTDSLIEELDNEIGEVIALVESRG